ncbi:MAG: hypothetical protein ABF274_08170 [Nonlabens sp.]|uniref:hypothetical protein n=1 Tax=Nonlabens sp. TaxID=1888209 RepID=UPI0032196C3C
MKRFFFLFLSVFSITGLNAQVSNDSIAQDFSNFLKIPEANIYLHLNRSVLMQGEDLGFTAYVFDHKNQTPSLDVKNLYCQVLDHEGIIIKEQMLLIQNGKANGKFTLDEQIPAGNYTIRSFTNWMKNFKSPHYFETAIKVIDESGPIDGSEKDSSKFDIAHILPEGGHLVENVLTTVGLKIESSQELKGKYAMVIIDGVSRNRVLLDENGMGRFTIQPKINNSFEVYLEGSEILLKTKLPNYEDRGIVMSCNQSSDKVFIEIRTNQKTLDQLDSKKLTVLINSNKGLNIYDLNITDVSSLLTFSSTDFAPGVNQISLLTEDEKVISKRLFFNFEGFSIENSNAVFASKKLDSVETSIEFDSFKNAQLSVSVHTVNSLAIDRSQSIAAEFKLYPYLYGKVKDPLYYLKGIDKKKRYEMDNLMLCMGWEMYDWDFVFKKRKIFNNAFESGLLVKANVKSTKTGRYMIYPSSNLGTSFVELGKGDEYFSFENYFPYTKEDFKISEVDKNGKPSKPRLSVQFFPKEIPNFVSTKDVKPIEVKKEINDIEFKPFLDSSQTLDTIVLQVKADQKRQRKITNTAKGRVDFFTDEDRRKEVSMFQYLRREGLRVERQNTSLRIYSTSRRTSQDYDVTIIIDDVVYRDPSVLEGFSMADVDYIEIDLSTMTRVLSVVGQGQGGVVKIKTNPLLNPFSKKSTKLSTFDPPLTFSAPVDFFSPSYYSYSDDFFDKFGVIDWQGDLEVIDGKTFFTMPYLGKNKLLLHIQGFTENGELIDEFKELIVN